MILKIKIGFNISYIVTRPVLFVGLHNTITYVVNLLKKNIFNIKKIQNIRNCYK